MAVAKMIRNESFLLCACSVTQCLAFRDLPGSDVHGIFQARILEWVAICFSRGSSQPRDQTCISCIPCIGRWVLYQLCHLCPSLAASGCLSSQVPGSPAFWRTSDWALLPFLDWALPNYLPPAADSSTGWWQGGEQKCLREKKHNLSKRFHVFPWTLCF